MIYIYLFLVFSALGWLIDSIYRSLIKGKLVRAPHLVLLSPEYGAGALTVLFTFSLDITPVLHIILSWLSVIVVEYIFSCFQKKILGLSGQFFQFERAH